MMQQPIFLQSHSLHPMAQACSEVRSEVGAKGKETHPSVSRLSQSPTPSRRVPVSTLATPESRGVAEWADAPLELSCPPDVLDLHRRWADDPRWCRTPSEAIDT